MARLAGGTDGAQPSGKVMCQSRGEVKVSHDATGSSEKRMVMEGCRETNSVIIKVILHSVDSVEV